MNSKCIDILAVNETRLDDTISSGEVTVPGKALERNDRNRDGGGVALYIRNTINYERLFDLECESLDTWYRPPRSNVDAMKDFELLVQRIESVGLQEIFTHSGVCHIGISGHSLIYGVRKFCIPKGKPKIVESRQIRNFDANSFHADLNQAPWH
ncbi:unnamed protein product, partial [Porites evermanni]